MVFKMQALYERYSNMLPALRRRVEFTYADYRRNQNTPLAYEALRRFSKARRDLRSAERIVNNIRRDSVRRSQVTAILSRRLPYDVARYVGRF